MYAMYLRKSRSDIEAESLGEMETLARHRKILTELARRNGHRIVETYQELVSGEMISDRPEAQRLIKDVNKKIWKGVYVMEVERLARGDTKDQGIVSEAFKYSKTLIITPSKTYDPDNSFDEEYFEFGLFMSRREYKTIQRRLTTGKIQSVKEGNYVATYTPYGYDFAYKDRQKIIVPNDDAKNVQMMFEWFVNDGMTCGAIARKLTRMGILTRTGKIEWDRGTIREILQNEAYIGKIRWFKRKTSREFDGERLRKRKRRIHDENVLLIDGIHEPLVSVEMFEKAQKLFVGQIPAKLSGDVANPLAGLMYCSNCGKSMPYKKVAGSVDRFAHKASTVCKMKSTIADNVMDALVKELQNHISDFEFKLTEEKPVIDKSAIVSEMEKELDMLEKQRNGLFDKLERGIYTDDEFLQRKETLTQRIDQLSEEIYLEKRSMDDEIDYEQMIYTYRKIIDTLRDERISAKEKNRFLKTFIKRIEYTNVSVKRGEHNVTLDVFFI